MAQQKHVEPPPSMAKIGKLRQVGKLERKCHGQNMARLPTRSSLVGGLEHLDYFSIYWECHHPN